MKRSRKKWIAVKVEATKGAAETLAAADFAILAFNASLQSAIEFEDRAPVGLAAGQLVGSPGVHAGRATFSVELRGSGTAGTAPAWAAALQGCGLTVTNIPGTSDAYAPTADLDTQKTVTIALVEDGRRKVLRGAMGNAVINGQRNGNKLMVDFDFQGIWVTPTDDAQPAGITHETTKPIRFAGGTFTVDAASQKVSTFRFDLGNDVQMRADVEDASGLCHAYIADRRPVAGFDPESDVVANDDLHADFLTATTRAFDATFGTLAGNRAVLDIDRLQIQNPQTEDRSGLLVERIDCLATALDGDDEYSLTLN
ncbi:MAG: hypothetical protein AAGI54_00710 [Planctomycetota bacterium]